MHVPVIQFATKEVWVFPERATYPSFDGAKNANGNSHPALQRIARAFINERRAETSGLLFLRLGIAAGLSAHAQSGTLVFEHVEKVAQPASSFAHEPSFAGRDGKLYLSWMERRGTRTAVMMAIGTDQHWFEARVVHQGSDLFVNWADSTSIAVFPDETIAVHWLREIGPSSFDYQIEIALSADLGATWSDP